MFILLFVTVLSVNDLIITDEHGFKRLRTPVLVDPPRLITSVAVAALPDQVTLAPQLIHQLVAMPQLQELNSYFHLAFPKLI